MYISLFLLVQNETKLFLLINAGFWLLPSTMSESEWHTITIKVPFASPKHAMMAKQVIEVDAQLSPQSVKRTLTVEDDHLIAIFRTETIRLARLTLYGFLENVELIVRTLEQFGEDAESRSQALTN